MASKSKIIWNYSFEQLFVLFFALYTCRSLYLAFDKASYSGAYTFISLTIARLCIPAGIIFLLYNRKIERKNITMLFLPLSYWMMQAIHTTGGYIGGGELTFVTSAIFVLLSSKIKGKIFRAVYWTVQINNLISLILWCAFFFNDKIGFVKELYYAQNGFETAYYYRWWIFAIYSYGGHSFRLCGIFNEPGVLGTVCALLFICTFTQSKWWEKVLLLVTGILTLSLAFALLIFLFIMLYICQKRLLNNIYIFLFLGFFLIIPHIDFHNKDINDLAARFAITSNGLAGDNRTSTLFDIEYQKFINSNELWFGRGSGTVLASSTSSYKSSYIVPFGIFGTAILLGSWCFSAYRYCKKNRHCILYIIFFFISLYQRPNAILSIWGYVFLFGGVSWIRKMEEGYS